MPNGERKKKVLFLTNSLFTHCVMHALSVLQIFEVSEVKMEVTDLIDNRGDDRVEEVRDKLAREQFERSDLVVVLLINMYTTSAPEDIMTPLYPKSGLKVHQFVSSLLPVISRYNVTFVLNRVFLQTQNHISYISSLHRRQCEIKMKLIKDILIEESTCLPLIVHLERPIQFALRGESEHVATLCQFLSKNIQTRLDHFLEYFLREWKRLDWIPRSVILLDGIETE